MSRFDFDDVQSAGLIEASHNAEAVWNEHGGGLVPVDLVKIIKAVGLKRLKNAELPSYVRGICLEIEPGQGGIAYNDASFLSKRWTVAHEIGHWCMGHVSSFGDPIGRLPHHQEQEADAFAGALLLPPKEFLAFCKQTKPTLLKIQQRYQVTAAIASVAAQRPGILKYISVST